MCFLQVRAPQRSRSFIHLQLPGLLTLSAKLSRLISLPGWPLRARSAAPLCALPPKLKVSTRHCELWRSHTYFSISFACHVMRHCELWRSHIYFSISFACHVMRHCELWRSHIYFSISFSCHVKARWDAITFIATPYL